VGGGLVAVDGDHGVWHILNSCIYSLFTLGSLHSSARL